MTLISVIDGLLVTLTCYMWGVSGLAVGVFVTLTSVIDVDAVLVTFTSFIDGVLVTLTSVIDGVLVTLICYR